ncbi:L-ascorbate metabolism protein UlaG (beta-lactamase superfamily) [Chryseobacterium sp. 52]|uniref:MBL fold metallo-hydrolase n=1 Tax=Chryseobacterium sp. 52 TaxID=2035213 RepID=UPI000C1824B0|nr:MBL fold metallo-hydrolase [Chryseobacterium sp. 52]PIF44704.1 L-ascorbate metabolism protein UlaG (beta-lactamase superfamily) [Chryseobacterium sp. 52]
MTESKNDLVYLKSNIVSEALFNQWYANSHLLSPLSSGLNIKERHVKIMESYIEDPKLHMSAVKNPALRGGPFVNFKNEQVAEVKVLLEKTFSDNKDLIELADAFFELNEMLEKKAKGGSLIELYRDIPEKLKGYVELVYDLNNRASFRVYELLLYKKYYKESNQSILLQLIDSDDSRPFVLSTPRLNRPDKIKLDIPFKSQILDELFRMIRIPDSYSRIKTLLQISESDDELFRSFFSETPPEKYHEYDESGIRVRYFGHASILLETKELNILVDPVISYEYDTNISRYTYNDLPQEIDYLLITHNHQDHVNIETLIQLRHKVKKVIVPRCGLGNVQDPSLKIMLNAIGFDNVAELSELETIELDKCAITGLPFYGEHADLDIQSKICFHVRFENDLKVVLASDSCNIQPETYDIVHDIIGDIDILFLGMECDGAPLSWVYGSFMPKTLEKEKDQSRRLAGSDYEQAFKMVKSFNPTEIFVYAMGMEPWLEYISSVKYTDESRPIKESNRLIEKCREIGLNAERLYGEKMLKYDKNDTSEVFI